MSYNSNLSRRHLLRVLGGAAGVICSSPFLASCGSRGETTKKLNFWGTGTLDIPDWAEFNNAFDAQLIFEDNHNDPGPVIAKLVTQREKDARHVSGLQGGAEATLAEHGAIIPWNMDLIPNYKQLWPWARDIAYTRVNNEVYGIPAVINADSMIYLPDKVGQVSSYSAVFDPDLRGKTSMENSWINSVIFTAIYLKENRIRQITDPSDLTETELREVMRFLSEKAMEGQFRRLWSGWKDAVELVTSEQVWVMTGWEPIVYAAQRHGVNAAYAVPKEGYEGWSNDLLLHPGAKRAGVLKLAHSLANWELDGYYGCRLTELRGYVVPTDAAVQHAQLYPETFDARGIERVVEHVKTKFLSQKGEIYWQRVRPTNYELYDEEWRKFQSLV